MFQDTVRKALEAHGGVDQNTVIVIAGLSNSYSHYITTYEEYRKCSFSLVFFHQRNDSIYSK